MKRIMRLYMLNLFFFSMYSDVFEELHEKDRYIWSNLACKI